MNFIFEQIREVLEDSESVVIIPHHDPDGDACGSALAMMHYLRSLGKSVQVFCRDLPPSYLSGLPGIESFSNDRGILVHDFGLALFVDCADISRGAVGIGDLRGAKTVNVDHHATNPRFADINSVDHKASSTSEIIHRYLSYVGFDIDKKVSQCLLAGIMTDTGTFINAATSPASISAASSLVRQGANISLAFDDFSKNKSLPVLRLWGEILSRLRVNRRYGIAYTYVKQEDYRKFGVDRESVDEVSNFLNVVVDAKACFFFKFEDGFVKASSRTTRDDVDLATLAKAFGGGGHRKAAGFTVNWPLAEQDGRLVVK